MIDVSVIIPVYNVKQYLQECLDSLLSQKGGNFEFICIDDGSTDGSSEILVTAAKKDFRIQLIRQENLGLSAARNRGLDMARGRYVLFVDSDDRLVDEVVENENDIERDNLSFILYENNILTT